MSLETIINSNWFDLLIKGIAGLTLAIAYVLMFYVILREIRKKKAKQNFTVQPAPYSSQSKKKIKLSTNPKAIDTMDGIAFEEFLASFFRNRGFEVTQTPRTEDYGADLILHLPQEKIAIQAKRYHTTVGVKAVQEVVASKAYYGCSLARVITSSFFTENAKTLAKVNGVQLWDRDTLLEVLPDEEEKELLKRYDHLFRQEIIRTCCPRCGSPLKKVWGKNGRFIGCTTFPRCQYSRSLQKNGGQ